MTFSYRFKIITRVLLLALLIFLCLYAAAQVQWYTTTAVLALLALVSVVELIVFTEQWRREFKKFLMSVKYRDFTGFDLSESARWNVPEYKLAFRQIAYEFQQVRLEKEAHFQYLQTIIRHINTALFCFDAEGDVAFANPAANAFFGVHQLRNISHIRRDSPEMYDAILAGKGNGDLLKILLRGRLYRLSVQMTHFRMQDRELTLVSFRDIRDELEETELESWKKLIQVLTHEIMNSATPISSLSKAMLGLLHETPEAAAGGFLIPADDYEVLRQSIGSIENRSRGMLKFVDDYRNLSRLPKPEFEKIEVKRLVDYVVHLLKPELDSRGIAIATQVQPAALHLAADHEMLQRVLLNLILNSIYAVEDVKIPRISVSAVIDENSRVNITVSDNGRGIAKADMDKIFIPFFSTRKGGSGLGLSISREIVRMHRGKIHVSSTQGEGASFSIVI